MSDASILRSLAGRVADIANSEAQRRTAGLHRAVNSLRQIRPVVLIDELPWNQLAGDEDLELGCEDELMRGVELDLRRTLYRHKNCGADMLIPPVYPLPRCVSISQIEPDIREDILEHDAGNNIVSHRYLDQLSGEGAEASLRTPEISVDERETYRRFEVLDGIFGDILPIRLTGVNWAGNFSPWDMLPRLRGVEPLFEDLYDRPEFLHAYMRRYTDIRLELLDRLERMNLLDAWQPIVHCTPGLVDGLPGELRGGRVTRANMWGRGMAQIFASVSPEMHEEFDIRYQREFFAGFGHTYYGCCEPLHMKMDIVKKLPNLRKVSITPWADVRMAAEQMGADYVLSRKPNPAAVAVSALDEDLLRRDILETLGICRETGTPCEFILKDISSVAYHPQNLTRWERVAMETVENF